MITLITVLHILVSIGLILVVLLQTGKGADMGAVFGGSSSTIFGSSGAGNFLTRLTTGMAIVFMITSLTLGYFSGRKSATSLFESQTPQAEQSATEQGRPVLPPEQPSTTPQAPAQPAPQQPQKPTTP
ncbi:MAG TPA: preprotein translocase subunit SecG [Candidatus Binatia bacterium]|jgi:preprotein translocase subunit SecG|nr:preprotein translocase subunit SecG [Candidatus Binatia bacterium]